MNYNQKAFIIGMIGDFLLQLIVKYHPKGDFAGLKSYFKIHGRFESLLIAQVHGASHFLMAEHYSNHVCKHGRVMILLPVKKL